MSNVTRILKDVDDEYIKNEILNLKNNIDDKTVYRWSCATISNEAYCKINRAIQRYNKTTLENIF